MTVANKNYICTSRDNANIQPADHDLEDVSPTVRYPQSTTTTIPDAVCYTIFHLSEDLPNCGSEVLLQTSELGRCSSCKVARYEMCKHQASAKLQIKSKLQLFVYSYHKLLTFQYN